jgi:hypothetical protein
MGVFDAGDQLDITPFLSHRVGSELTAVSAVGDVGNDLVPQL